MERELPPEIELNKEEMFRNAFNKQWDFIGELEEQGWNKIEIVGFLEWMKSTYYSAAVDDAKQKLQDQINATHKKEIERPNYVG